MCFPYGARGSTLVLLIMNTKIFFKSLFNSILQLVYEDRVDTPWSKYEKYSNFKSAFWSVSDTWIFFIINND